MLKTMYKSNIQQFLCNIIINININTIRLFSKVSCSNITVYSFNLSSFNQKAKIYYFSRGNLDKDLAGNWDFNPPNPNPTP